jgi:hypothetical protein
MIFTACVFALGLIVSAVWDRLQKEDCVISREITRLVRETKKRETQAEEEPRRRMSGHYAMCYKKAVR